MGTACCEASRCCPRRLTSALVPVVWRFAIPVLLPLPVRNTSVRCALCSWDSVLLERGFLLLGGSITPGVGCPAVAVLAVLFLRTVVASLIALIVGLPFSLRGSSSFAGPVLWVFALFAFSGRRRFAICCLSCFALCVLRGFRFLLLPPFLFFLSFLPLSRPRLFVVVGIVITVVAVIAAFFRLILQERLSEEDTHSETNSSHLDPRENAPPFSDELNAPRFELPVRLFQLWARPARAHCRCWHSDAGGVHQVRGQVHFAITRLSRDHSERKCRASSGHIDVGATCTLLGKLVLTGNQTPPSRQLLLLRNESMMAQPQLLRTAAPLISEKHARKSMLNTRSHIELAWDAAARSGAAIE